MDLQRLRILEEGRKTEIADDPFRIEIVLNLLFWRHSGFSAHAAVRVEDRPGAVRLGRYMIRCPIVLERLGWSEETSAVLYSSRPSRRAGSHQAVAR